MSQANAELVRSIYAAFSRRDWDLAFRDADPDFELTLQRGPNSGTHRGREKARKLLVDQASAFDRWIIEPDELLERGDLVVAIVRFRLQPKGSNAEFEVRNGWLWSIREGTVVSLRGFPDPKGALEAAGLSG